MSYENILFDVDAAGIATLTINRPQALNALTTPTVIDMQHALNRIEAPGSGVRCLLLTGAGRGFSAGADLSAGLPDMGPGLPPPDLGAMLEEKYNPLAEQLMALPVPIVTAVNGPAAGAGCSLALIGDIAIAARSAYFLQAFVNIGLVPDVASTWLLPRLIGKQRAQAMMMLGEKVSAETAASWGMIYEVVDDAALMDRARAIATRFANGPTEALRMIRTGVRRAMESSLTETLRMERIHQRLAGVSDDFAEGVAAFHAKRPPRFGQR